MAVTPPKDVQADPMRNTGFGLDCLAQRDDRVAGLAQLQHAGRYVIHVEVTHRFEGRDRESCQGGEQSVALASAIGAGKLVADLLQEGLQNPRASLLAEA